MLNHHSNRGKILLSALKKAVLLGLIVLIYQLGTITPAMSWNGSDDANSTKRLERQEKLKKAEKIRKNTRIVIFSADVTEAERMQYVSKWSRRGVKLVKDMPFINGVVLRVPRGVSDSALARDDRVASVTRSHKSKITKGRLDARWRLRDTDTGSQFLYISGDGGSGDGGSGDGGSGDGGSGDGGSGDGGSTLNPMFIPVDPLGTYERPWGILDLFNQFYDPQWLTWKFDQDQLPAIVDEALNADLDGNAIRVAILDTGVNYLHPDLSASIAGGVDLVGGLAGIPMDNHGHGTHVAGSIVSNYTGSSSNGLVELYAVKILNDDSSGDVATLLMGIEWAMANNMDIISMSVAYREDNVAVHLALQQAYQAGIILVAAAGNHSNWEEDDPTTGDGGSGDGGSGDGGSGDGGSGDGGSGDGGSGDGGSLAYDPVAGIYPVMYPARYAEVIAVGAMDAYEQTASFSNTGPEVDVLAPGVDVISTAGAGYALCNGTSMSVPHVTGAVILMKALAEDDQYELTLTPAEAKTILAATAYNGTISLEDALMMVLTTCGEGN